MGLHLNYEPKRMAERVGFTSQRFAKLSAVKDMPQNAAFTAIFVVSHLSHTEIFRWPPFHGLRYGWYGCGSQQPSESEKRTSAWFRTYHRKFRSIHPHSSQSEL